MKIAIAGIWAAIMLWAFLKDRREWEAKNVWPNTKNILLFALGCLVMPIIGVILYAPAVISAISLRWVVDHGYGWQLSVVAGLAVMWLLPWKKWETQMNEENKRVFTLRNTLSVVLGVPVLWWFIDACGLW